jgi:hypothetical protein
MAVSEHGGDLLGMLQGLLVVVLLITIGINVMFILDTNRRLHEEIPTAGIYKVTNFIRVGCVSAFIFHYRCLYGANLELALSYRPTVLTFQSYMLRVVLDSQNKQLLYPIQQ